MTINMVWIAARSFERPAAWARVSPWRARRRLGHGQIAQRSQRGLSGNAQDFRGGRHRLVTVIGGTTAHVFAKTHIRVIGSEFLNPHEVRPQAYAPAPYFGNGLDFITYEGGRHLKQNSDAFCANPAIYDIYLEYLGELEKHFSHPAYCYRSQLGNRDSNPD